MMYICGKAKGFEAFSITAKCIQQNENDILDRWKNPVSPCKRRHRISPPIIIMKPQQTTKTIQIILLSIPVLQIKKC